MAGKAVGTVGELWRFPVKSMGGEPITAATITLGGVTGDRGWALRDEEAGQIRNAKLLPRLLQFTARYLREPDGDAIPPVEITDPDGVTRSSDDPSVSHHISEVLGRPLTLWPLQPASNTGHYRRGKPYIEDPIEAARANFGLEPGEPSPDGSSMASLPGMAQLREFATPPGTYFDVAPLHIISSAALRSLAALNPAADADRRRFRANVVVESDAEGFPEFDWCDRRLQIGDAIVEVRARTLRCAMPTHAQPGLERAPSIMRTLVRETNQDMGVYALILQEGEARPGDPVILLDN